MMKTLRLESTKHRSEVNRIVLFYTHRETALYLSSHLVHSTNNTPGLREQFIQVLARTQDDVNSVSNRTVKECDRPVETVVSAATVDIFTSGLGSRLRCTNMLWHTSPPLCWRNNLMVLPIIIIDISSQPGVVSKENNDVMKLCLSLLNA